MKFKTSLLLLFVFNASATSLDEQYSGFFECKTDTYIDQLTGEIHGEYFEERKLKPCEINANVASFCIKDSFLGLPVSRVDIPNTYSIVLLRVDSNISYVRDILKEKYKVELGGEQSFSHPYLIKDPENKNKTLIICEMEP